MKMKQCDIFLPKTFYFGSAKRRNNQLCKLLSILQRTRYQAIPIGPYTYNPSYTLDLDFHAQSASDRPKYRPIIGLHIGIIGMHRSILYDNITVHRLSTINKKLLRKFRSMPCTHG
jgi:hypothetical protein